MLAFKSVSMAATSRGKVKCLVSVSRRLSTHQPSSSDSPLDIELRTVPKHRPRKDPSLRSVLIFPGQGSQFVGMARGLLKYPNVSEMFSAAQKILGYDLLSLCLEGPEDDLQKTVHCQPAVFVTSLAAMEKLQHENPKVSFNLYLFTTSCLNSLWKNSIWLFQPLKCYSFYPLHDKSCI